MTKDVNVEGIGGACMTILAAAGITQEVVQIIYYVLGCLALVFSLSFTIYKWYKSAKADGKITIDEIKDLEDKIKDTLDGKDDE